jgi:hypothetical protein
VIIDDTPIRIGSCGAGDTGGEAAEEERTRIRKRNTALPGSALIHRNPVDALMEFPLFYPRKFRLLHFFPGERPDPRRNQDTFLSLSGPWKGSLPMQDIEIELS